MDFQDPPADPFGLFQAWFDDAGQRAGMICPNAFTLATVRPDGAPAARTLLLKGFDMRGLLFFTNYQSPKARELETAGRAAMLFYWDAIARQVRIEGTIKRVSAGESDAYYATRPRGSRIGAWASEQSQPLDSRATLEQRVADFDEKYPGDDVPRPPHWGGYLVTPLRFEFWEGKVSRLHDRMIYQRSDADAAWANQLLYP